MLVSIIIPCYNQAEFIDETLLSVFNQQYAQWECLLIDDGSTDNTAEIINKWVIKDNRFSYHKKENKGVSAARNFGLSKAKGDFIQFLDSDDLLASDKLLISIDAIQKQEVDIVCSNYLIFSKTITNTFPPFSQLEKYEFNFYNLARYWNDGFTVPIHCWFFKAALLKDIQFPEGLTAQEDWVTWLRVFQNSPKTYYIPKQLALYRKNPNGRTNTAVFFNETLQALDYMKQFISDADFQLLYEAVIMRYNSSMVYWKNRQMALKKSNSYQFGLFCKKLIKKIGLLPLAKKLFQQTKLTK
ncbi:MAG: glycosyltransferase family 2 protein [Flavobacterium sp.]|uniref:glycosyltransferase family 2 protein n=1 Tax=Flavobacterium sp. TaxID=239 RepID=UPI00326709FD